MALSRIVAIGNGSATQFSIPFALGYIRQSDITCRVGTEADGAGNPIYRPMTFIGPELVDIAGTGTVPANGERVEFTRTVDREALLVDYEDGDIINEENMNTAQKQAIMLVHEVLDGRFEAFQSNFDLGGFQIKNLGDPTDATDAATKQYVDARINTGAANAAAAAASAAAALASQNAAAGSAANAATSAGTASTASAAAIAAKDISVTARNEAVAANGTAQSAATASSASAAASTTKAGEAAASATAAGNSAAASASSATSSETARAASVVAKDASVAAKDLAVSAKSSAELAQGLAQKWANNPEDVVVAGGEFSAKHYAAKASVFDPALYALKSGASFTGIVSADAARSDVVMSAGLKLSAGDWGLRSDVLKNLNFDSANAGAPKTVLKVSQAGIVLRPHHPAFSAYRGAAWTAPAGVNLVAVPTNVSYNIGGHYETTTGRFTAPVAGVYYFTVLLTSQGGSGANPYLSAELTINGARSRISGYTNSAGGYTSEKGIFTVYLNAGDYVQASYEAAVTLNMNGGPLYQLFSGGLM